MDITKVPSYYINLDEDVDRRESVEQMLKDYGFNDVTRFSAIRLNNKRNSVSASHLAVLEMVRDSGVPALVFEDDVIVENFRSNIEIPEDADAIYLGKSAVGLGDISAGLVKRSRGESKVSKISEDLYKIESMYAAHAILYLNKEYVDFCIRLCKTAIRLNVPHDVYLGLIQPFYNIYGYRESIFSQTSSIKWTWGPIDSHKPYKGGSK